MDTPFNNNPELTRENFSTFVALISSRVAELKRQGLTDTVARVTAFGEIGAGLGKPESPDVIARYYGQMLTNIRLAKKADAKQLELPEPKKNGKAKKNGSTRTTTALKRQVKEQAKQIDELIQTLEVMKAEYGASIMDLKQFSETLQAALQTLIGSYSRR